RDGVPEEAPAASRAPGVGREPKWGGLRRGRCGVFPLAVAVVRVTGHRKLGRHDDDDIRIQFCVGFNPDLRRVRTRTAGWLVQQGTVGTQAEHQEMRRVRRRRESAGADEEGPHEVGGGRLPDLLPSPATRLWPVYVHAVLREGEAESQSLAMIQKRVDAGNPVAMCHLWNRYTSGLYGLEKDVARAIELIERAAVLGSKRAHSKLGYLYHVGAADVEKDTAKAIRHYEAAAIKGDAHARCNLGIIEDKARNYDIALQHYMIAAKLGHQGSLNNIKKMFMDGLATKSDYAEALRGHQSAVEEMRSPDREEALVFR
ncbi:hypothetical protein THAOC_35642, partial [Thalassiosira oceanica]